MSTNDALAFERTPGNTDGEIISHKEATRTAKIEELEKRVEKLESLLEGLLLMRAKSDDWRPTDKQRAKMQITWTEIKRVAFGGDDDVSN